MLAKYYLDRLDSRNFFDPFYSLSELAWSETPGKSKRRISYDVTSDDNSLTLTVDLPGVKKEDLQVEATGQTITVKAKRGEEDYSTTYKISKEYDSSQVDAHLDDGVLTLKFNRAKSADVKRIVIR